MKTQTKFNIFRACKASKICEDCYSKLGFRMNKQKYLELFDEESIKPYLVNNPVTLENLSRKYPRAEAEERYRIYAEKQRIKNTYEFKKQKYGWTEKQFKEYNKSRSVTLENCIKKHGKEKGTRIFNDYCEKQRESGVSLRFLSISMGLNREQRNSKRFVQVSLIHLKTLIKGMALNKDYKSLMSILRDKNLIELLEAIRLMIYVKLSD